MRKYEIAKYKGLREVEWNGTIEDLEGHTIKVYNNNECMSYSGRVENGKAVAWNNIHMTHVAKALKEIR